MFILRKPQIDAFSRASESDFEDRMVVHLQGVFPSEGAELGEGGLRSLIRQGVERSARYGVAREYDICLYLHVMIALGPRFDEVPEHAWTRELLDEERSPSSRVDELHDRVFGVEVEGERDEASAEGYQGH